MQYRILSITAAILFSLNTYSASAQVKHKSVVKTVIKQPMYTGLTLENIVKLYLFEQLPDLDEYLTSRKWSLGEVAHNDTIDKVKYNHHSISNGDEYLNVFFCNTSKENMCAKPDIHKIKNQHIMQVIYIVNKKTFDRLQSDIRAFGKSTDSQISDNDIAIMYKVDKRQFVFRTILEKGVPIDHHIIFTDVTD
jgi:hypothetical protein